MISLKLYYKFKGVYYKRNGSLYFTKVEESHAGLYSCTPYNELGSDGPSSLIKGKYIVCNPSCSFIDFVLLFSYCSKASSLRY